MKNYPQKRSFLFPLIFAAIAAFTFSGCQFYDDALRELKNARYDEFLLVKFLFLDATPPTVTSIIPDSEASGVARNMTVSAIFSEDIDPETVTPANFVVTRGGVVVDGTLRCVRNSVIFKPISNFEPNTPYDIVVHTGLKDRAGNALEEQFNWYFTTGLDIDITPPSIIYTFPENNSNDLPINGGISAVFSENLDLATVTSETVTVTSGGATIKGSLSCINNMILFKPAADLTPSMPCHVEIAAGIKDLAGNTMAANYSWDFTASEVRDDTPPTVAMTQPQNNATGIDVDQRIYVYFSEPIDPSTVSTSSFYITKEGHQINGSILCTNTSAIFRPLTRLDANSLYRVMVMTKVADMAGNQLEDSCQFTFITASGLDTTPPSIIEVSPQDYVDNATSVKVRFSEDIQFGATITVYYESGTDRIHVPGSPSYDQNDMTLEFIPTTGTLTRYRRYHVTVSGVKDLAGNPMSIAEYTWSFLVGPYSDTTKPTIDSVTPEPLEPPGYYSSVSFINAHFSEAIQDGAAMTVSYDYGADRFEVPGSVFNNQNDRTLQFIPDSGSLPLYRQYHVSISGVKDLADNPMETDNYRWSFNVGPYTDTTAPTISKVTPSENSMNNVVIGSAKAFFNEDIEPDASMTVCYVQGADCINVSGTKSYNQNEWSLQFVPNSGSFPRYRQYRVTVSNVRDRANNPMGSSAQWLFWAGAIQVQLESASNQYHGFGTFGYNGVNTGYTLRDNYGNPLMGLVPDINTLFDLNISGPMGSGKYLRMFHRGSNVHNLEALGLRAVVKTITGPTKGAPDNGTFYIDPTNGRFILPRPHYWSRLDSIDEITNSVIKDENYSPDTIKWGNLAIDDVFPGKFNNSLYVRNGCIDCPDNTEINGGRAIYPFNHNKFDFSKGTVSVWVKLHGDALGDSGILGGYSQGRGLAHIIVTPNYGSSGAFYVEISYTDISEGDKTGIVTIYGLSQNDIPKPVVSLPCINNDTWHHIYIVWDGDGFLEGSNYVRVWVDGNERAKVSSIQPLGYRFTNLSSSYFYTVIWAYIKAGGWGHQVAGGFAQMDNLKVFRGVTIEDPNWEYKGGTGRENALNYIYGPDDTNPEYDYRPRLIGTGSGVGYYH